jgi:hypothetical protein
VKRENSVTWYNNGWDGRYFISDEESRKVSAEMVWPYWTTEGWKIGEKCTALVPRSRSRSRTGGGGGGARAEGTGGGREVLKAVVMKSIIFWNVKACSPLSVNRRFGGTYCHLLATCFHAGFLLSFFSILRIKAICSSETSVDTRRTTTLYIPEDDTLDILSVCGLGEEEWEKRLPWKLRPKEEE